MCVGGADQRHGVVYMQYKVPVRVLLPTFTPTSDEAVINAAISGVNGVHSLCYSLVATYQAPVLQVPYVDSLWTQEISNNTSCCVYIQHFLKTFI